MIEAGDEVKLLKSPCADCSICKEAMSGYFEVLLGDRITLDLPASGICFFDERDCEFEFYIPSLENK